MEQVNLQQLVRDVESLKLVVNELKSRLSLDVACVRNDELRFGGFESQEGLDAWNEAGDRAFEDFEIPL